MNITSKQEKNNEIKPENNIQLNEQDVAILEQNVNMPFSNILSQQLTGSAEILNNRLFKYGKSLEENELIEVLTDKKLSVDDFVKSITEK